MIGTPAMPLSTVGNIPIMGVDRSAKLEEMSGTRSCTRTQARSVLLLVEYFIMFLKNSSTVGSWRVFGGDGLPNEIM